MIILPCNHNNHGFLSFPNLARAFLFAAFLCPVFIAFHAQAGDNTGGKKEKVHISADGTLVINSESKYFEFSENVRATLENAIITSDKLSIYYSNAAKNKKNTVNENSIKKIVAKGNVKIEFDNNVAESQQAVYTPENRLLILSGGNPKVVSGNDHISGSKIIISRADGKINVDGPVDVIFHPDKKENGDN